MSTHRKEIQEFRESSITPIGMSIHMEASQRYPKDTQRHALIFLKLLAEDFTIMTQFLAINDRAAPIRKNITRR